MKTKQLLTIFLVLAALTTFTACNSQKTTNSSSSSNVDVNFGGYAVAKNGLLSFIIPNAYAAVSDLRFCFKRVRFKRADEDTLDILGSEDNVDFEVGEVVVDELGVHLGTVDLPTGLYQRIEFDLEDSCGSGNSVEMINDNGMFASSQRITIKFRGHFSADEVSETLNLSVQKVYDAIKDYDGLSTSLKDTLEASNAMGTF